ncbi:hypothetical protein LTR95_001522 [Oleoguttula sp. CCFEE 5521]
MSSLLLPGSDQTAIGTKGLNGCTCVVILGTAIILAHISPLPGSYDQWAGSDKDTTKASREHHDSALRNIARLVGNNAAHFPSSTTAWGIFSQSPEGPMRSVIAQVQTQLHLMGYGMRPAFYQEIAPKDATPPKGEVVSLHRYGVAELYLESRRLWPTPVSSAPSSSTQSGPSLAQTVPAPVPSSGQSQSQSKREMAIQGLVGKGYTRDQANRLIDDRIAQASATVTSTPSQSQSNRETAIRTLMGRGYARDQAIRLIEARIAQAAQK